MNATETQRRAKKLKGLWYLALGANAFLPVACAVSHVVPNLALGVMLLGLAAVFAASTTLAYFAVSNKLEREIQEQERIKAKQDFLNPTEQP